MQPQHYEKLNFIFLTISFNLVDYFFFLTIIPVKGTLRIALKTNKKPVSLFYMKFYSPGTARSFSYLNHCTI